MKKQLILSIVILCLFMTACGNITEEKSSDVTSKPVTKLETETINNTDPTEAATAANENSYSGIWTEEGLKRERLTDDDENDTKNNQIGVSSELSEEELQNAIYEKYYELWTEEEMMTAINERSQYLLKSAYAKEVSYFWENIREVTDIANVVEPLYHTDMKFYTEKDFENAPPLIIYLAKNEIYARHGYIFKNEDLNNYFMGQIWYEPIFVADEFDDSAFDQYEKINLELLSKLDTYNK